MRYNEQAPLESPPMTSEMDEQQHRVAIVYHFWPHYRLAVAKALCRNRTNVYTLVSDQQAKPASIPSIDPQLAEIPPEDGGLRWLFVKNQWFKGFLWQQGILRVAWSRKYDTIMFLGVAYFLSTWVAALIARCRGKKVLMWTHGFTRCDKGVRLFLRKCFYRLADSICLYGCWARDFMIGQGFDPEHLHVIYNSLDYDAQREFRNSISEDDLRQVRQRLFSSIDTPVALFIGRLTPQKRLDLLIHAVAILRRRGHLVNILLIGGGDEEALRSMAKELGISEQVKFYGPCHEEQELAPMIMMADVCVAPGEVGLTAMHSLAYGTPVITHDEPTRQMPEYEAIAPGVNGDLFVCDDVEDLARVIEKWTAAGSSLGSNEECYRIIEQRYNAHSQVAEIEKAIASAWGSSSDTVKRSP